MQINADAHGSVKIRPIGVIRVLRRDGGTVSYAVKGIAELCAPSLTISSSMARISFCFKIPLTNIQSLILITTLVHY